MSKKKAYCLAALSTCSLIFAIVALTAFEGSEVTYFDGKSTHKCYYSSFGEISTSNYASLIELLVWQEQKGIEFDTHCNSYNVERQREEGSDNGGK